MASPLSLLMKNVSLPGGRVADLTLADGIVQHTGAGRAADRVLDCTGLMVLPAATDMHVHMRGGPQAAKEDWETGSKSALAGGVTVVVDQPNTIPPLTTPEAFRDRVRDAREHSLCNFAVNGGVTPETLFNELWAAGVTAFGEIFFAASSYGDAVSSEQLRCALDHIHALGGLATIHAEEVAAGPDTSLDTHARLRSAAGEKQAVLSVIGANTAGCRIHFCHLSSGLSVDAASSGTVEVTPHHLFLTREKFTAEDAFAKVNPPLRSERERKDLVARWKRIDVVASDHAPHTMDEKGKEFAEAPSGIPGVETMVPLLLAAVLEKRITLPDVIAKTSTNPSAILGIPPAGFRPGSRADFAVYPRKMVRIDPDTLHSRCGWTPFTGMPGVFPERVILGGAVVYEKGVFFRREPAWIPGNGYHPESRG